MTRSGGKFNKLGEMIPSVSYCVDGQDLPAVVAHRKVFDTQLNYSKYNGMSASEFIQRKIADALKEAFT